MSAVGYDPLELLTIAEACRLLKMGKTTLYREIKAGHIRPVKLAGSTRIPRAELERYIAEGQVATLAPVHRLDRKGQS